jgi:serine/threonine-protein kinase
MDFSDWNRYQVIGQIGEGGMGKVYKAFDPRLKRHVALKFVKGDSDENVQRFIQEARSQAQLSHENICRIYEVGEFKEAPYIAMQYIEGDTLQRAAPEMTLEQKVLVMKAIADAVHEAHRHGIIHRDIKPPNIMLERSSEGRWTPYIMDFGLAREIESPSMTMSGVVMGTANYISPEQAYGEKEKVNRRSDVYSLGATIYEFLTGTPPFTGDSPMKILLQVVNDEPTPLRKLNPIIAPDLETIVLKCLEKDPLRRYDSARALAEDLRRYIDGEPVQARRPTLTYRIYKKVKKYKITAAVAASAFVILMVLMGMWLQSRWEVGKIAEIAQEFGRDVMNIESMMRISHTIPLHDTRPERKQVYSMMRDIRDRMGNLGATAAGPGNYALGRGHLLLQDHQKALEYLNQAWEKGYQTQHVAYALGLALTTIFQIELENIETVTDESLKAFQRKKIEEKYLQPALKFLKMSRGMKGESPEYVEALVAYGEKKYEAALAKARLAFESAPWLYEAKSVQGDIFKTMGMEKKDRGDIQGALTAFRQAGERYGEAMRVAESDPQAYLDLCLLWKQEIDLVFYEKGEDITPYTQKALSMNEKALIADPEFADAYEFQAYIFSTLGEYRLNRGQDPSADLSKAIESGQKTAQLDPGNGSSFLYIGNSYLYLAYNEMMQGKSPMTRLSKAFDSYKRAIAIDPEDPGTYSSLGMAYAFTAQYQIGKGTDPQEALREARDNFLKAIGLYPDYSDAYSNLGGIYQFQASYDSSHGKDPLDSIKNAIDSYQKAIAINSISYAYRNLGFSLVELSGYQIAHGLDPRRTLDEAEAAYRKLIKKNPNDPWGYNGLGMVFNNRLRCRRNTGQNPQDAFSRAIANFKKSIKLSPQSLYPYINTALAYVRLAEYRLLLGESPRSLVDRALEYLQKAREINPNDADIYLVWRAAILVNCEYDIEHQRSPQNTLRYCRTLHQKTVAINASLDEAYRQDGLTALLEARLRMRLRKNPQQCFHKAEEAFKKAVELNPLEPENYYLFAELYHWRGKWALERKPQDAVKSLQRAVQNADRVLAVNPEMARALALKGTCLHLEAEAAGDDAESKRLIQRGNDSIRKALKINPHLSRRYKLK